MATESDPLDENWRGNYFNYFTEVEEHFQRARGTALFLLSPLDWALIESWKNAGVPLAAVLRGIDLAFEKWRAKKTRTQAVNSLAYCAQAIATETEAMAKGGPSVASASAASAHAEDSAPFSKQELAGFLEKSISDLRAQQVHEIADAIGKLLSEVDAYYHNLEELEQRLTALEEKMIAQVRSNMPEEDLFAARRELDLQLKPYRSKMNAGQLAMLEKQFLERKILESNNLPRLSLFYLR